MRRVIDGPAPRVARGRGPLGAVVLLACAGWLAGCFGPESARREPAAEDHTESHAAEYKASHGIRLHPDAARFAGLEMIDASIRADFAPEPVLALPARAVLRTVRGSFVYVDNGGWLLRSPVTVGRTSGDWIEIRDGLYEGDVVAAAGVDALWLAEIAAVNGGVGCADGH